MTNDEMKKIMEWIFLNDEKSIHAFVEENINLINDVTPYGTMLSVACRKGKYEIVKYLIEKGCDVNLGGGLEASPLVEASLRGYSEIVELLLANGAELDVSSFEANPLFAAISNAQDKIAIKLIDHGIDVTAKYDIGEIENCDALEYARQYGLTEVYDYLKSRI